MKKTGMWALLLVLMISPSVFAAGNADAGKEVYTKRVRGVPWRRRKRQ